MIIALRDLHSNNIAHIDIKPGTLNNHYKLNFLDNILLSKEGNYVLGDFGHAVIFGPNTLNVNEGDSSYYAPEFTSQLFYNNQINLPKADIFSLGVTILELMLSKFVP